MFSCLLRNRCITILATFILCVPRLLPAQTAAPVRYHLGDDSNSAVRWADPKFDDSAWPVAQQGLWPMPAFYSDGFIWVRVRVPVPSDAEGPLAIRGLRNFVVAGSLMLLSDELFVNGRLVGHQGSLPPSPRLSLSGWDAIFDLPDGVATPGTTAIIAFRAWYPPFLRQPDLVGSVQLSIDEIRNLKLSSRADHAGMVLANGPDLALNSIIAILGLGLLVLWRWAGGRDLLLCSWMLISMSLFSLLRNPLSFGLLAHSWRVHSLVIVALQSLAMAVTIEFIWSVHGLRIPGVKRLFQAAGAIFNLGSAIAVLIYTPSQIGFWSLWVELPAILVFSFIQIGVNFWILFLTGRNRIIAIALIMISVAAVLPSFGLVNGIYIGPFYETYFGLAFFLCEFGLFVMLGQRAWRAWRARDELRIELDAAREVQQQLITPAVNIPGFQIETVYTPATQVGGDFFRVLPEGDGGLLVVMGDVSGKGLRAAMTVSAVIGALRTMPPLAPSRILSDLNRGLAGQLRGGFVTCCAARIKHDGAATIANAGHLAPYRNGAELEVGAGMPLGIVPETDYEESQFLLEPGDALTFLSDGVVEARNSSGELFGFARTLRISGSGAEAIAKAAVEFGQDDDITVLTLTRLAVGEDSALPLTRPARVQA